MALATIKSTRPAIYEPLKQTAAVIYLEVLEVTIFDGGYKSKSRYYVVINGSKTPLKIETKEFTRANAIALQSALQVTGANFDEQLFNLIPKVALYRASQSGDYGLLQNEWEMVV